MKIAAGVLAGLACGALGVLYNIADIHNPMIGDVIGTVTVDATCFVAFVAFLAWAAIPTAEHEQAERKQTDG